MIQCNLCGSTEEVRELQNPDGTEWPCCRTCFMGDKCNPIPPISDAEKENIFRECCPCN